jgi:hypothetical protein
MAFIYSSISLIGYMSIGGEYDTLSVKSWILLAQDRGQWRAVVNTAINVVQ